MSTSPLQPPARARFAGAVLCGGRSTRMGADKATLIVDGLMMAERVARVLEAAGCEPVQFVGGDVEQLSAAGRAVTPDLWPGAGPVGGVLSALDSLAHHAPGDAGFDGVVVVACDLVALTPDAVRSVMLTAPHPVTVAISDRLEPLLACWSPAARSEIAGRFVHDRSLTGIIEALGGERVHVDPAALVNANRPGDLTGHLPGG